MNDKNRDTAEAARRDVDDEYVREAMEANWRCSHQSREHHGHVGTCEQAALGREKRLLEILERRS